MQVCQNIRVATIAVCFIACLVPTMAPSAAVPGTISYQAVITQSGNPVTGSVNVIFKLYDAESAGSALWTETRTVTADAAGRINVALGEVTPFDDAHFSGTDRWLAMEIGGEELLPRAKLTSSGYTFRVATVDGANSGELSGALTVKSDATGYRAVDQSDNEWMSTVNDPVKGAVLGLRLDGTDRVEHTATASTYYNTSAAKDPSAAMKRAVIGREGLTLYNDVEEEIIAVRQSSPGIPEMVLTDRSAVKFPDAVAQVLRIGGVDGVEGKAIIMRVEDASGNKRMETTIDNTTGEPEMAFFAPPTAKSPLATGPKVMSIGSQGLLYYNATTGNPTLKLTSEGDINGVGQAGMGNTIAATQAQKDIQATDTWSTVFGFNNTAASDSATVSGGYNNQALSFASTISGGATNTAGRTLDPEFSRGETVGGGGSNLAEGRYSTVGGGAGNYVLAQYATIAGGQLDTVLGLFGTVGGGFGNMCDGQAATIAGGYQNQTLNAYAAIGGGNNNVATGQSATVAGGNSNSAVGLLSAVGGGYQNVAQDYATIAGGYGNEATQLHSAVAGGRYNRARGQFSAVGGGGGYNEADSNAAWGHYSIIPGGRSNLAAQDYSFAAGRRAKANHAGAFVWADHTDADFASERMNQFRVRADGGTRFDDGAQWINVYDDATDLITTSTGAHLTLGGAWTNSSDENLKENFASIDVQELLQKIAQLSIREWNYKSEGDDVRHIGPTAQDFRALFGLGTDDKSISTIDPAGIALAAIQGLQQENCDLKERIAKLEDVINQLASERR